MKLLKIAGILAVACVLVFACVGAVSATEETPTGEDPETEGDDNTNPPEQTPTQISEITVTGVTAPTTGGSISTSGIVISTTGVTKGDVVWKSPSGTVTGTFASDVVYTLEIAVTASEGYVINSGATVSAISSATSKTYSSSDQKIIIVFPATTTQTISSVTLTGINSPVVGYKGSTTATISSPSSGVNVSEIKWYKGSTECTSSAFTGGSSDTYKVTFKLTAITGYKFSDQLSVSIGSWATVTGTLNDAKTEYTAQSTAVAATKTINKITISNLDDPSTGVGYDSSYTITGNDYYTSMSSSDSGNSITWYKRSTSSGSESTMSSSDVFESGKYYSVKIVLKAPTGYSFATSGLTAKIGDHTATTTGSTSSEVTLKYNFGTPGAGKITVVNITSLKVPGIGDSPTSSSYTTATAKGKLTSSSSDIPLSASVEWYLGSTKLTSSDTFEANKKYKAKITVTLGSSTGYEFNTSSSITTKVTDAAGDYKNYTPTTSDKTKLVVDHEFAETNGTISSITISLTAPAIDGTPATYATVTSVTPSASLSTTSPKVTWNPYHTKFTGGYTYDVTIILTANDGFTFGSYPSVTLSGTSLSSSAISVDSKKETLTIHHTYPKVTSAINEVYLDVSRPVAGHKPSTAVKVTSTKPSILGVTGTVAWSPSLAAEEEFAEHTVYTATVTLTNSNSDYAFSSSTKVYVNGEAATVSGSGTQMKATYKFTETGEEGLISIGDVSIPYPADFFHEFLELIKAFFMIGEWKLFE